MLQESILQYFRPSLSYHLSFRPLFCLFCLFLSGRFTQVLLYMLNPLSANHNWSRWTICDIFGENKTLDLSCESSSSCEKNWSVMCKFWWPFTSYHLEIKSVSLVLVLINSLPVSVICWSILQTIRTKFRPNKMLALIWIQTVWHSDGIPRRIFLKKLILKKISRQQKSWKISQHAVELTNFLVCLRSHDRHCVIPRVAIRYLNPWPHNDTFFRLSTP